MHFERNCTVAWAPSGNAFAVSDAFASNESRVTIFSLTSNQTLVPVTVHLPPRIEQLLAEADHSYVDVSAWTSAGLRLVAWGYGGRLVKEFRRKVVCTLTSESTASCVTPNSHAQANTAAVSEQKAQKLAERAFLEETKHQILTYSVERLQETPSLWRFLVQGTGNFARPGYHWFVEITKETGAARVVSGE
jgi:hypothetical protein